MQKSTKRNDEHHFSNVRKKFKKQREEMRYKQVSKEEFKTLLNVDPVRAVATAKLDPDLLTRTIIDELIKAGRKSLAEELIETVVKSNLSSYLQKERIMKYKRMLIPEETGHDDDDDDYEPQYHGIDQRLLEKVRKRKNYCHLNKYMRKRTKEDCLSKSDVCNWGIPDGETEERCFKKKSVLDSLANHGDDTEFLSIGGGKKRRRKTKRKSKGKKTKGKKRRKTKRTRNKRGGSESLLPHHDLLPGGRTRQY